MRHVDGPFMMPIVDKYSEMGTVVIGKVESGQCKKGDILLVMPNKTEVKVDQLWSDDIEVTGVTSGENIKAKVGCFEDIIFLMMIFDKNEEIFDDFKCVIILIYYWNKWLNLLQIASKCCKFVLKNLYCNALIFINAFGSIF